MLMLQATRPVRQRQVPALLNRGNPICQGLVAAFAGNNGLNLVNGDQLTRRGAGASEGYSTTAAAPFGDGMGLGSTSTTAYGWYAAGTASSSKSALLYDISAPPLTIGVYCRAFSTSGNNNFLWGRPNGGGTPAWAIWPHVGSSNGFDFQVNMSGGTIIKDASTTSPTQNYSVAQYRFASLSIDPTNTVARVDNVFEQSIATPSGTFTYEYDTSTSRNLLYGSPTNGINGPSEVGMAALWNRRLSKNEHLSLAQNPWQLFAPAPARMWFAALISAQLLLPTADVAAGAWISSLGGSLFTPIGETTPNDADYDYTTSPSVAKVTLATGTDPLSSTGHVIHVRAYSVSASQCKFSLYLADGTTLIAEWTDTLTTGVAQYDHTLTAGQADAITNYAGLQVWLTAL